MIERQGDLWTTEADFIVVPINWTTRHDGTAVMGAGVALQAKQRYPRLERHIGDFLLEFDTPTVFTLPTWEGLTPLIAFPTKRFFKRPSTLKLVEQSARELPLLVEPHHTVVLPRVGCGLGGLDWETQVRPILAEALDDRFLVVAS